MNFLNPWFWIVLYGVGFFILLGLLGPVRMRTKVYANGIPRPVVMAFMLIFMILPPLVLPFTGGPGIGMPWTLSVGLGGVIFGANIIIKVMSQKRIGVVPAIKATGGLVTQGIYSVVRHPLYMSNGLMALGLALIMDSLTALVFSVPYFLAFLIIIYFEETVLMDQYGQEYLAYKQKVPWRMIPGII